MTIACRNNKGLTGRACAYKTNIREEALDEEVIVIAQDALGSMKFNEDAISALGRPEDLDKLAEELDKLLAEKKQQMQKHSRLLGKIKDLDPDDEQFDALYAGLQEILRQIIKDITDLDSRIAEISNRIRNAEEGAISAEQMLRSFQTTMDNFDLWPDEVQRDILHGMFSSIELLPESRPGGQRVKSVRFKLPVRFNGKIGHDLDVYYDGDDDDNGPPDGDPPSGGDTPLPEASGSPGYVVTQQGGVTSGGADSHASDSVPNPAHAMGLCGMVAWVQVPTVWENSLQIAKFQGPRISSSKGLERVENTGFTGKIAFSPHELGGRYKTRTCDLPHVNAGPKFFSVVYSAF